jgi:ABC transporter fused permease/ATP-binding protein
MLRNFLEKNSSLKKILNLALTERRYLAMGFAFLIVSSAAGLVYPQLISWMLDATQKNENFESLGETALWVLLVFSVQSVTSGARHYLFSIAGERIVVRMRQMFYRSLMYQDVGFFDQNKTGDLLSRLSADVSAIQSAASVQISIGLRHAVSLIGGMFLLFYTSPILTGLMFLIIPPLVLLGLAVGRRLRALSRRVQERLGRAVDRAQEAISGIRIVRSFSREGDEVQRYSHEIDGAFELAKTQYAVSAFLMSLGMLISYGVVALVLWYGGSLVVDGELSLGSLASFMLYTMMVAFAAGGLADLWGSLMSATGAIERVSEILDRQPDMILGEGKVLEHVVGTLEFKDVSFAYPSRPDIQVLDQISFKIDPGMLVAFVGPSGSGKSTIAALAMRFYDPVSGNIYLDDHSLLDLDSQSLRMHHMGVVMQESLLFSMTIEDNIRYGSPHATSEDVRRAAEAANAHEFISSFPEDYKTEVGERGVQLSGGQRQRLAIARAILKDPKILLLDEATSALDARSEHLVQGALDRLMKGRTTLVIAHRLSTVMHADLVVVLDKGRIVEMGTHDSLWRSSGLYHELVSRQLMNHQVLSSD